MKSFLVHQLLEGADSDSDTTTSLNSPPSSPKPETIDESVHRDTIRVSFYSILFTL